MDNDFDDRYRVQATATLTERHLLVLHPFDYAGQLMAFERCLNYRVSYARPLLRFGLAGAQCGSAQYETTVL
jgi:hypothetical protein